MANSNNYDLILQNNGSKEFFVYSGLSNASVNHLFYEFDVDMEVPDGEYTYVVLINNRDDVVYELKTPILSTILHTGEGDVELRDLQPATGLLRVGKNEVIYDNIYDETADNDTFIYYDN